MSEYRWFLIYLSIGLVGGIVHWFKKRYVDQTTALSFFDYMRNERQATYAYVSAILIAELGLSQIHIGDFLTLTDFVAAFGAGFMADSSANKALDRKK